MKIDPNTVMAVIALSAIVSPTVVAIFNNHHIERLKDAELLYERNRLEAKHQESEAEKRVNLLTSFVAAVNNFSTSHEQADRAVANSNGTKLIEFLNAEQRIQALTTIGSVNSYTNFDDGKSNKELQASRKSLNTAFPEWLDYIKQLPVEPLPKSPKFYRSWLWPLQTYAELIRHKHRQ